MKPGRVFYSLLGSSETDAVTSRSKWSASREKCPQVGHLASLGHGVPWLFRGILDKPTREAFKIVPNV